MPTTTPARGDDERRQPRLHGIKRVAQDLGVSVSTIRRLVARGELPVFRVGTQLRLDGADVVRYLNRYRLD